MTIGSQQVQLRWRLTVFVLITTILLFFDSRIIFRIVFGPNIAEIVGVALAIALLVNGILIATQYNKVKSGYSYLILLFGLFTFFRYIYAGISVKISLFTLLPFFVTYIALVASNYSLFIRYIINAIFIVIIINALIILFPISMVSEGLRNQTALESSSWNVVQGIIGNRALGLFSAPGFLAFFASISFGVSITTLFYKKNIGSLVALSASLFCGFSSGNRSFLLGLLVSSSAFIFLVFRNDKSKVVVLIKIFTMTLLLVGIIAVVGTESGYFEFLSTRLGNDTLGRDINTRLYGQTGIISGIEAFFGNPIFGALSISPLGIAGAFDGYQYINAHNGVIHVFATRGMFLGITYVILVVSSIIGYLKVIKIALPIDVEDISALFVGMVTALSISMIEPLGEVTVILVLIGIGLGFNSAVKSAK